jgi:alpha-D-ribose 1-methylphosphonate 5-triphosphate synthase subunit PhnL
VSGELLEVTGLTKTYVSHGLGGRRLDVLRGVDLVMAPAEMVVVRGPSGSGKSTLLRCVYRSALADSGSARLGPGPSLDLLAASDREVLRARRERMAMTTQVLQVVPRVTALDLVRQEGVDAAHAAALLERLGFSRELHDLPPATFSGGERQLLNLALALAQPRPLLLLDEVTAALDPARRVSVYAELLARKRAGTGILAVFHDVPATPGLVDRVLTMADGALVAA